MKAWTTLGTAPGFDGQQLVLQQRDQVFVIRAGGMELMSSLRHHSEEDMARVGLEGIRAKAPTVLIGGLGLGYTARATLDALPKGEGRVVVAEISPAVVEWNRGVLADLAGRPLEDPRTEIVTADVATVMKQRPGGFDCILLDVDNGPSAKSSQQNQKLYETKGIALIRSALTARGCVVIWSAGPDAGIVKRLGQAGFEARAEKSLARQGSSSSHVLFVGQLAGAGISGPRGRPSR